MLLCGFLVSRRTLESNARNAGWGHPSPPNGAPAPHGGEPLGYLVFLSYLYPAFELVMSDELLGQTTFIKPLLIDVSAYPIPGAEVNAHT